MNILFCASHPNLTIGYSRVAYRLANYLAKFGKVYYFAFSNFHDKGNKCDRKMDPNIVILDIQKEEQEIWQSKLNQLVEAEERLRFELNSLSTEEEEKKSDIQHQLSIIGAERAKVMELRKDHRFGDGNSGLFVKHCNELKIDYVLIYNDILVINNLLGEWEKLKYKPQIELYFDLTAKFEKFFLLQRAVRLTNHIYVFSKCWGKHLIETFGVPEEKVTVLRHGLDVELFMPISREEARKEFDFIPKDAFVILNNNRNTYRKALDFTVLAFLYMLRQCEFDSRLLLIFHTDGNVHYDLPELILSCMIYLKYSPQQAEQAKKQIKLYFDRLNDDQMNKLYAASDVGINTCLNEGFGLCNLEHALVNKPQIVPDVGALHDNLQGLSTLVKAEFSWMLPITRDAHGGLCEMAKWQDYGDMLVKVYKNYDFYEDEVTWMAKKFRKEFNWDNIMIDIHLKPQPELLIDCFSFFNEHDMVKKRIELLKDKVDYFLILESKYTYSGFEKEMVFDKKALIDSFPEEERDALDKKILYIIHGLPIVSKTKNVEEEQKNHWIRERQQREFLLDGLSKSNINLSRNSLVMVSDCDEIPNLSNFKYDDNCEYMIFEMDMFYYSFKWKQRNPWYGSYVTRLNNLLEKGMNFYRDISIKIRSHGPDDYQNNIIKNGGWHLSYFGDIEKLKYKLESFAHHEHAYRAKNDKFCENLLKSGHIVTGEKLIPNATVPDEFKGFEVKDNNLQKFKYEFTEQWMNQEIAQAIPQLFKSDKPYKMLEVGTFEGRSACFLSDIILDHDDSTLLSVDSWDGSGVKTDKYDWSVIKERAHKNVSASKNGSKVTLRQGKSSDVLSSLQPETFDFIFLDGSDWVKDLSVDISLAYPLLKKGGVLWIDDFLGNNNKNVQPILDAVNKLPGHTVIHQGYQLGVKKDLVLTNSN